MSVLGPLSASVCATLVGAGVCFYPRCRELVVCVFFGVVGFGCVFCFWELFVFCFWGFCVFCFWRGVCFLFSGEEEEEGVLCFFVLFYKKKGRVGALAGAIGRQQANACERALAGANGRRGALRRR